MIGVVTAYKTAEGGEDGGDFAIVVSNDLGQDGGWRELEVCGDLIDATVDPETPRNAPGLVVRATDDQLQGLAADGLDA